MIARPSSPAPSAASEELTLYGVLAERARSHSWRFLAAQAALCAAGAALLLTSSHAWWPLAALLAAVTAYGAWGLIDAAERAGGQGRLLLPAKLALAALATVAGLLAAGGAALAAFSGDAPGPYGMCYGADGRAFACDAKGMRR